MRSRRISGSTSSPATRTGQAETRAHAGLPPPSGLTVIDAFYRPVGRLLTDGVGIVAEISFRRRLDEARLRPLLGRARMVNVHCQIDLEVARARFLALHEERMAAHARIWRGHPLQDPGHRGGIGLAVVAEVEDRTFDWSAFDPLDLPIPRLICDTSDGYDPSLEEILPFCVGV